MTETKTEVIKVNGTERTLTLTQECYNCRFPSWLKERSKEWYSVMNGDKYLGDVFFAHANEKWKVYDASVVDIDGTLIGCLTYLFKNG